MLEENILTFIKEATPQHPIGVATIAQHFEIAEVEAHKALDNLYVSHAINQAKVIRGDDEVRQVWPTGFGYKSSMAVAAQIKTSKLEASKELLMLRFIYSAGKSVTGSEIKKAADADTIDTYLSWYIKNAFVIKTDKKPEQFVRYYLADSDFKTADDLYSFKKSQMRKPAEKVTQTTTETITVQQIGKTTAEIEVPTFIGNENGREPISINDFPQPTADWGNVEAAIIGDPDYDDEAEIQAETQEKDPVSFAITSDGTLMLFGIGYSPIELTKPQTDRLIEFMENTSGINL